MCLMMLICYISERELLYILGHIKSFSVLELLAIKCQQMLMECEALHNDSTENRIRCFAVKEGESMISRTRGKCLAEATNTVKSCNEKSVNAH